MFDTQKSLRIPLSKMKMMLFLTQVFIPNGIKIIGIRHVSFQKPYMGQYPLFPGLISIGIQQKNHIRYDVQHSSEEPLQQGAEGSAGKLRNSWRKVLINNRLKVN